MSNVAERVRKIIAAKFGIEEAMLLPETSFVTDLGANSLDLIEIVMEFEKEFGIEVRDADIEAIKTIGDAQKFIENLP